MSQHKKEINRMIRFASAQRKCSNNKLKCYTNLKGEWEERHADYMQNEARGEIIIWDWVIESLTKFRERF